MSDTTQYKLNFPSELYVTMKAAADEQGLFVNSYLQCCVEYVQNDGKVFARRGSIEINVTGD